MQYLMLILLGIFFSAPAAHAESPAEAVFEYEDPQAVEPFFELVFQELNSWAEAMWPDVADGSMEPSETPESGSSGDPSLLDPYAFAIGPTPRPPGGGGSHLPPELRAYQPMRVHLDELRILQMDEFLKALQKGIEGATRLPAGEITDVRFGLNERNEAAVRVTIKGEDGSTRQIDVPHKEATDVGKLPLLFPKRRDGERLPALSGVTKPGETKVDPTEEIVRVLLRFMAELEKSGGAKYTLRDVTVNFDRPSLLINYTKTVGTRFETKATKWEPGTNKWERVKEFFNRTDVKLPYGSRVWSEELIQAGVAVMKEAAQDNTGITERHPSGINVFTIQFEVVADPMTGAVSRRRYDDATTRAIQEGRLIPLPMICFTPEGGIGGYNYSESANLSRLSEVARRNVDAMLKRLSKK